MIEQPCPAPIEADPEPVLAGTLSLMSAFVSSPDPATGRKIVHNLEVLASHAGCSPEFRVFCCRMRQHWLGELFRKTPAAASATALH